MIKWGAGVGALRLGEVGDAWCRAVRVRVEAGCSGFAARGSRPLRRAPRHHFTIFSRKMR